MDTRIYTRCGRMVDLRRPCVADIKPEAMMESLLYITRFTGHAGAYSVAQHSVLVACFVARLTDSADLFAEALYHDLHEAYVGDVASPLKSLLPDYQVIEESWRLMTAQVLGLPKVPSALVRRADRAVCAVEMRDLMPRAAQDWAQVLGVKRTDIHGVRELCGGSRIRPWTVDQTRETVRDAMAVARRAKPVSPPSRVGAMP